MAENPADVPRRAIPENLLRLQGGEDGLRQKSLELIGRNDELSAHVALTEQSMDVINFFVTQHVARDPDEETIQYLGIRMFNGLASALRLILSGYFQAAAMIQRDLLESTFLVSYFRSNRQQIARWRNADSKLLQAEFSPVKIRDALDKRDGFTGRKRAIAYKLFCELATHPTYKGFQMLGPRGQGAHCGPFLDEPTSRALIGELAKLAVQAAETFMLHFPSDTLPAIEQKLHFMEARGVWAERFYNRPFDRAPIEEMKALVAAARRE